MGYRTLVNEMQDEWRSQGAMTRVRETFNLAPVTVCGRKFCRFPDLRCFLSRWRFCL